MKKNKGKALIQLVVFQKEIEVMENKAMKCSMCRSLDRYYTKGDKQYIRINLGRCSVKKCIVNADDLSCDKFVRRCIKRRVYGRTQYYLNELLLQITALRSIIEEDTNEPNE